MGVLTLVPDNCFIASREYYRADIDLLIEFVNRFNLALVLTER